MIAIIVITLLALTVTGCLMMEPAYQKWLVAMKIEHEKKINEICRKYIREREAMYKEMDEEFEKKHGWSPSEYLKKFEGVK